MSGAPRWFDNAVVQRSGSRRLWWVFGGVAVAAIVAISFLATRRDNALDDGSWNLHGEIASYTQFPVYWLGPQFEGIPFDRVMYTEDEDEYFQAAYVLYGNCGAAFLTGCEPEVVLRIQPDCLSHINESERIRGRTIDAHPRYLAVQAGEVTIDIFAASPTRRQIAHQMIIGNGAQFPEQLVDVGEDLPGSLCELARFNARSTSTPPPPEPTSSDPERQATQQFVEGVFDAFGESITVHQYKEAEDFLGWKILRTDDPRYVVSRVGNVIGDMKTFKNRPWLFSTMYDTVGHGCPISFLYLPESYLGSEHEVNANTVINGLAGELQEGDNTARFRALTDAQADGERVYLSIVAPCGYTNDELRNFIETLGYGE
jgi:hypothetical protein